MGRVSLFCCCRFWKCVCVWLPCYIFLKYIGFGVDKNDSVCFYIFILQKVVLYIRKMRCTIIHCIHNAFAVHVCTKDFD